MTDPQSDAPHDLFETLYRLVTWASLGLMVVIVAWLLSMLFGLSPSGTAQSQELAIVRPTQTALAVAYGGADAAEGAPVVVDLPVTCAACHAIEGTSAAGKVCPDLTHIGTVSAERIASADYSGAATTVEEYIRESILEPNTFVLQGTGWVTPKGDSTMPAAVGQALTQPELDRLITYLASLE
jgi:cytochrome c2